MRAENKDYIEFSPSYWIYNAGLVGIIRTLVKVKKKEKVDYKIEKETLKISKKTFKMLPNYLVYYMSIIFSYFETNISKRNPFETISSEIKINDVKFWFNIFFSKNGIFSNRIDIKNEINSFINKELKKTSRDNNILNKFHAKYLNKNKYSIKKLRDFIKKSDSMTSKDLCSLIQNSGNKFISNNLHNNFSKPSTINKDFRIQCSSCHKKTNTYEDFSLRFFSFEGGSADKKKGFPNFYWYGSNQKPICKYCQLVLYFSPLGIFPDSHTNYGEFINVPDVESLWKLNNYRFEVYNKREKEKWLSWDERSKLIDAIVSTGAYLQLKSKWLLQNIEIIEIGGNRKNTVYTLNISPVSLKLLSDHSSQSIVQWLNQVEDIKIRPTKNILYKKYNIYSNKWINFTKGREIIDKFLNNDTGWIIKISILLFKLFFEEDKQREPLNDFNKLIVNSLKPLLMLNICLLNKNIFYSNFYQLGKSFSTFFKKRDDFKQNILPSLFNSIYTLRKNSFLEIIMRIYMKKNCEIDEILLATLRMNNVTFQTEAMLFIIGILEKLYSGDKNG